MIFLLALNQEFKKLFLLKASRKKSSNLTILPCNYNFYSCKKKCHALNFGFKGL